MSSIPRSNNNYEVATELTWGNGQLSLHDLESKQTPWINSGKPGDHTLESIVHQATNFSKQKNATEQGKYSCENPPTEIYRKRVRSSDQLEESDSATFCRDTDTTMMTWPSSFESPASFKRARTANTDDFDSENQDGECTITTKGESSRSQSSSHRSRAAAIHNLSERRRRDRINQRMRALQKLVPNASKTDKASMLDEVIEYLKQLQAQVRIMSNARNNMPQMVPLGLQQQIQMSLLARMGMGMGIGMGMGMFDVNNLARNMPHSLPPLIHTTGPLGGVTPSFVPPHFTIPTPMKANVDVASVKTAIPNFNEAYNTFLAQQSMNLDFFTKMSTLYRQEANQPSKKPDTSSQPNNG